MIKLKIPKHIPSHLDEYACFRWVATVIESCQTFHHCNACERLIENYYHMFKHTKTYNMYYNILVQILEDKYIQTGLIDWHVQKNGNRNTANS